MLKRHLDPFAFVGCEVLVSIIADCSGTFCVRTDPVQLPRRASLIIAKK